MKLMKSEIAAKHGSLQNSPLKQQITQNIWGAMAITATLLALAPAQAVTTTILQPVSVAPTQAETTTILQPVSVTSSFRDFRHPMDPENLIDQSGLRKDILTRTRYISDVTNTSIAKHTYFGAWLDSNDQTQGKEIVENGRTSLGTYKTYNGLALAPPQATGTQAETTTTILQPVSVTSSGGSKNSLHLVENLINQSGLRDNRRDTYTPITYIHNVTNFMDFTSIANHTHDNNTQWESGSALVEGFLTFDLGEMFSINAIAIWNLRYPFGSAIRDFDLFADDDNDFNNGKMFLVSGRGVNRGAPSVFANAATIQAHTFFFTPLLLDMCT